MLFTPIILVCLLDGCTTLSGPAFETEEACYISIMEVGLEIAGKQYGSDKIVSAMCVKWDISKQEPSF